MSAFKSVVHHFATRAIGQIVAQSQRKRVTATIESAKSILVLFDGRDASIGKEAEALAVGWTSKGKQVQTLKLMPKGSTDAQGFTEKDTNWADAPKPELLQRLSKMEADLLLLFNPDDAPVLQHLAVSHQAGMKVCTLSRFPTDADLVFERQGHDLKGFVQEVEQFMKSIQV
jgi:hypothetical protein